MGRRTTKAARDRRRWATALATLAGLVAMTSAVGLTARGQEATGRPDNPTVRENQRPGTRAWWRPWMDEAIRRATRPAEGAPRPAPRDRRPASDRGAAAMATTGWTDPRSISAYATRASIQRGEPISFAISSTMGPVRVIIVRSGWYGGSGGALLQTVASVAASPQSVPPPGPDGRVEAGWSPQLTITDTSSWVSGFYFAVIDPASGATGSTAYAPFVVREDGRASQVVVDIPFSTYQAYNSWGGKSLYEYSSTGGRATAVSFDRPYADNDGLGLWFGGDYQLIRFLEREGYDVTYTTSADLDRSPTALQGHRIALTAFHDEYWSAGMRDAITNARDAGTSLAFLSSNNGYWQIRWAPSSTGVDRRTIVCFKSSADPLVTSDPQHATVLWRDPIVGRPENAVLGTMFDDMFDYGLSVPWVVRNSGHWLYAGTGLTEGAKVTNLVGYEWDRMWDNGSTPAGITALSQSPVVMPSLGLDSVQQATVYTAPSGAFVFDAGTNYWSMLFENGQFPADARVVQMTRNLVDHGIAPPPTTTTTSSTTTRATTTTRSATTTVPLTTTTKRKGRK